MDFTKIKHHKSKVTLEWTDEGVSDSKHTTLTSHDDPEEDFTEALQGLAPIVVRMLELPASYADGLNVIGVSLTYSEMQGRGVVITCLKEVGSFNAPLVINTPHLVEENEHGPEMPGDLIDALDELQEAARRFKDGHRLQMDMMAA